MSCADAGTTLLQCVVLYRTVTVNSDHACEGDELAGVRRSNSCAPGYGGSWLA